MSTYGSTLGFGGVAELLLIIGTGLIAAVLVFFPPFLVAAVCYYTPLSFPVFFASFL